MTRKVDYGWCYAVTVVSVHTPWESTDDRELKIYSAFMHQAAKLLQRCEVVTNHTVACFLQKSDQGWSRNKCAHKIMIM